MNGENALAALAEAANWRTSSRTGQGQNCVEVAAVSGWVGVRDSKLGTTSPILAFTASAWHTLIAQIKSGHLDASTT